MTCCGRLFLTRDAATGNDWSPTVVRRVRRMTSIDDDAERSLHRAWELAGRLSSSARYGGADLWRHLHASTASLKSIRFFAFSQWSWWRSGVMRSNLKTSRLVEHIHKWLKLPKKKLRNTRESRVTIVQMTEDKWRHQWLNHGLNGEQRMEESCLSTAKPVDTCLLGYIASASQHLQLPS